MAKIAARFLADSTGALQNNENKLRFTTCRRNKESWASEQIKCPSVRVYALRVFTTCQSSFQQTYDLFMDYTTAQKTNTQGLDTMG